MGGRRNWKGAGGRKTGEFPPRKLVVKGSMSMTDGSTWEVFSKRRIANCLQMSMDSSRSWVLKTKGPPETLRERSELILAETGNSFVRRYSSVLGNWGYLKSCA